MDRRRTARSRLDRPGTSRAAHRRDRRRGQGASTRTASQVPRRHRDARSRIRHGREDARRSARGQPDRIRRLFAQLALEELDFRLEAANLVDSTAVLEDLGADQMVAPRPIPGMVTERVLVMEYLPGVSYARLDPTLERDGDRLLRLGIQGVVEATLKHGVFHGDLHAGNVLIDEKTGSFSLVDFGIAGRLDAQQRAGLVQFLVSWAVNDAAGQIASMKSFGAIDAAADVDTLTAQRRPSSTCSTNALMER
ncbi:AarF/UbiB family protein [Aeromicrobium sp. UC242_57]|uniref:AarF/UbiB family protein n=1 Tax=Aeromicrobium sp. UC242_57 TaxID=3374624 RepID=UPI003797F567